MVYVKFSILMDDNLLPLLIHLLTGFSYYCKWSNDVMQTQQFTLFSHISLVIWCWH